MKKMVVISFYHALIDEESAISQSIMLEIGRIRSVRI